MKYIITSIILSLFSINTYSQVGLCKNLNDIKEENQNGELIISPKGGYLYVCNDEDTKAMFIYGLDNKLDCYSTIVVPFNKLVFEYWVKNLNENWIKVKNKTWKMIRYDKRIVTCKVGTYKKRKVFIFEIN